MHQVLDTEVTNVPAAWKLNVAKVFSSLPYYYRAAYDTADVIRGHVLAGMVHHNGRDGNDFKVCLHTTKATMTKQYAEMCNTLRDEHLRFAAGEGGGRLPDRILNACKDRTDHNNGGDGFPQDRQRDGTVVLRPHEGQDAVMKQRAVLLTHAVRIQEKRVEEEKLRASRHAVTSPSTRCRRFLP